MTDTLPDCEPFTGETLRADGWEYRDTPPMLPEYWKMLMNKLGEENVRRLTYVERTYKDDDRLYVRGQMFISPKGLENLKAWLVERKSSNDTKGQPS
jgi:hypothetical protein